MAETFEHLVDQPVVDQDNNRIGKVHAVLLDKTTNAPEWLAVEHGLIGKKIHLVPFTTVIESGSNLITTCTQEQVGDSPEVDLTSLERSQEEAVYTYYGMNYFQGGLTGEPEVSATQATADSRLKEATEEDPGEAALPTER